MIIYVRERAFLIELVMIAESVSLGVLSLPATLASLGLAPYATPCVIPGLYLC